MSQVFFFGFKEGESALHGLERLFSRSAAIDLIPHDRPVTVKLHMGEHGNLRHIRPVLVRKVVDIIIKGGGRPFLYDTVVNYPSRRATREQYLDTAARNGFVKASINAPILITDDSDYLQTIPVKTRLEGCELSEISASTLLLKPPLMVVLSHVKGHELAGMGGALKNLGMGCVSTASKRAQHRVNMPVFVNEKECNSCGKCVEKCPTKAITMENGKPRMNSAECIYCSSCRFECPLDCWVWPPGSKEKLQLYLGHAASAVLSGYRGKTIFVNFIQDVVPFCDCAVASGNPIVQDVGIALSFDPVAIDKASLDLIDSSPVIPGSTTAGPPDILGKIHHTTSLVQIETAEKLGAGEMDYSLVSV